MFFSFSINLLKISFFSILISSRLNSILHITINFINSFNKYDSFSLYILGPLYSYILFPTLNNISLCLLIEILLKFILLLSISSDKKKLFVAINESFILKNYK